MFFLDKYFKFYFNVYLLTSADITLINFFYLSEMFQKLKSYYLFFKNKKFIKCKQKSMFILLILIILIKNVINNIEKITPIRTVSDIFLFSSISKCNYEQNFPKIYCAVITHFDHLTTKAMAVNKTWGISFF